MFCFGFASSGAPLQNQTKMRFNACVNHEASKGAYTQTHANRYKRTFQWLCQQHPVVLDATANKPLDVLVLGGGTGAFETCLSRVVPMTLHTYEGDLSYPYCSLANQSMDLVTSCEVLEHLKDQTTRGISAHWQATGVFNHLMEISRVLRPGGRALITTPNLGSWDNIRAMLHGKSPFLFPPHVRELTRREVEYLMSQAGLAAHLQVETVDTYGKTSTPPAGLHMSAGKYGLDHHKTTTFAIGGPSRVVPGSLFDRPLGLWKKKIAIKLPGSDQVLPPGMLGKRDCS